ncbi:MAG: hypothetical protein ACI9FR_002606 [Cryomorphaceae bacterium]|jgi:hypothetical protein
MSERENSKCVCECGSVSYLVPSKPLFRMYCHCSICQKFNDAAYGDICVYRSADVERPKEGLVKFSTFRPPPNVQRGKCTSCKKPAIEILEAPLFPKLILVPGSMLRNRDLLPESVGHVFYEGRVADVQDGLPKHNGYLKSQLVFGKHLLEMLW